MDFNEIKKEVKNITFETLRMDSDSRFEAVMVKDGLANLTAILERFFGPPAWPSQSEMSPQVEGIINGFGGIMPGQTLYFWSQGSDTILAMLWPWQDGMHITVKIIKK